MAAGDAPALMESAPNISFGQPRPDTSHRAAPTTVGRVESATGPATVQHADGTIVALEPGATLHQRDVIATEPGTKLALVLADRSTVALGAAGEMRLDAVDYDAATHHGRITLSILKGAFAFATGDLAATESDAMTVRTPVGTISVRGTVVSGTVDPAGDSSFSAVPDPSGAPSIVAFANGAGSQLLTENTTISVSGFFAPPGPPVQLAALGDSGDLANIATTLNAALNPNGGAPAVVSTGQGTPGVDPGSGGPPIVVTLGAPPSSLPPGTDGDHGLPPPTADVTPAAPASTPPGHPYPVDNEPGAFGPSSAPGGSSPSDGPSPPAGPPHGHHFIGTLGQDVFHGTPSPDLFDFVTVPNSLQSGGSVDGGGGHDTLTAAFSAPFAIDHTLAIVNVPLVEITLPGSTSTFDASGVSDVSSLILHGAGSISLVGGNGIEALTVTDPDHHDTLGGFAQITYDNQGDPSGLRPTSVDLIDIPAGGTHIEFLNHPGDTLILDPAGTPTPADVFVTVSGAQQIDTPVTGLAKIGVNDHVTITGDPVPGLQVTFHGADQNTVTLDTTGPVVGTIVDVQTVVGSNFGDTLAVVGASSPSLVEGGAGNDSFAALSPGLVIEGGAGNNTLVGMGFDTVSYQDAPAGVVVDLGAHLASNNGYGGSDVVSGFNGVIGSPYNDVITTTDGTLGVVGDGGVDTVHLGASHFNSITLTDISAVDIVSPLPTNEFTNVSVDGLAVTSSFDLRGGGGQTSLEIGLSGAPTNLQFSDTSAPGTIGVLGVDFLTLSGGALTVNFDGTVLNGSSMQIGLDGGSVQFDASHETGHLEIFLGLGEGGTLVGTQSDSLAFTGVSSSAVVTLDGLTGSAMSGAIKYGVSALDQANNPVVQFADFGTLQGNGTYPAGDLQIGDATGISTINLQTEQISGSGGTATLTNFESVTNLTSTSLSIIGSQTYDILTAGSGDDTLTGGGGADTLIGGSGADHFVYLLPTDSYNPNPNQIFGPDLIENFHDSNPDLSVLDVAAINTTTQHFTGDKGTFTSGFTTAFATAFAGDQPGNIDYVVFTNPNATGPGASQTFVHVANGTGYSSSDLIVELQGAHALTAANFHLHP